MWFLKPWFKFWPDTTTANESGDSVPQVDAISRGNVLPTCTFFFSEEFPGCTAETIPPSKWIADAEAIAEATAPCNAEKIPPSRVDAAQEAGDASLSLNVATICSATALQNVLHAENETHAEWKQLVAKHSQDMDEFLERQKGLRNAVCKNSIFAALLEQNLTERKAALEIDMDRGEHYRRFRSCVDLDLRRVLNDDAIQFSCVSSSDKPYCREFIVSARSAERTASKSLQSRAAPTTPTVSLV